MKTILIWLLFTASAAAQTTGLAVSTSSSTCGYTSDGKGNVVFMAGCDAETMRSVINFERANAPPSRSDLVEIAVKLDRIIKLLEK